MDPRLHRFLDLLDAAELAGESGPTVGTSVRLPVALRDAAALATEMGLIDSVTVLTVRGLRAELEDVAQRSILDAHYEQHPEARPSLAEIALAGAELDGNPIAQRPELIERAAVAMLEIADDPTPDEVLSYAAGLAAAA